VPKISRPKSWEGYEAVDVFEAARRLGRTVEAVRQLIKKGRLKRLETDDERVMIAVSELERFMRNQRPVQLRLLSGRK
jgi:hypothetical protein